MMHSIKLACGTVISLDELTAAGISFIPWNDTQPILDYKHLLGKQELVGRWSFGAEWNARNLRNMKGVSLLTGSPTFRPPDRIGEWGWLLTVIDIEALLIEAHPSIFADICSAYQEACEGTPCAVRSKGGGVHLYAYTHYCGGKVSFRSNKTNGMLCEVLSEMHAGGRLDGRYSMLSGSLLDLPSLDDLTAFHKMHDLLQPIADKTEAGVSRGSGGALQGITPQGNLSEGYIDAIKALTFGSKGYSTTRLSCPWESHEHDDTNPAVSVRRYSEKAFALRCFKCGKSQYYATSPPPPAPRRYKGSNHYKPKKRRNFYDGQGKHYQGTRY